LKEKHSVQQKHYHKFWGVDSGSDFDYSDENSASDGDGELYGIVELQSSY
jgi:hypothetical protein